MFMMGPWDWAYRHRGANLYKTTPSFFFRLGHDIPSVMWLRKESPLDQRADILARSVSALEEILSSPRIDELLPRSREASTLLVNELRSWQRGEQDAVQLPALRQRVQYFATVLMEEMDRTHVYTATDKGNLSVDKLVEGASGGYPPVVLALLDKWMKDEIDAAGKCLAFTLYTACGFHILRSVEIGIKGYVHAATGTLPSYQ